MKIQFCRKGGILRHRNKTNSGNRWKPVSYLRQNNFILNISKKCSLCLTILSLNYIWPKRSLLYYGEVLWFFFTLRPSDLITILTYVLMDNFCPCFFSSQYPKRFLWFLSPNFHVLILYGFKILKPVFSRIENLYSLSMEQWLNVLYIYYIKKPIIRFVLNKIYNRNIYLLDGFSLTLQSKDYIFSHQFLFSVDFNKI